MLPIRKKQKNAPEAITVTGTNQPLASAIYKALIRNRGTLPNYTDALLFVDAVIKKHYKNPTPPIGDSDRQKRAILDEIIDQNDSMNWAPIIRTHPKRPTASIQEKAEQFDAIMDNERLRKGFYTPDEIECLNALADNYYSEIYQRELNDEEKTPHSQAELDDMRYHPEKYKLLFRATA